MRQQKSLGLRHKEQGYILVTVMAIMVIIALIIGATYTTTQLNLKATAGDADRRYALILAEEASRLGARRVAATFANPQEDVFPGATEYNTATYPALFTEFLEGGPPLITLDGKPWPQYFTNDCSGLNKFKGFCAPLSIIDGKKYGGDLPAWARPNVFNDDGKSLSCTNAVTVTQAELAQHSARNPCYIVEFLGINNEKVLRYRLTTMAWGRDLRTKVRLESIYETDYNF